MDTRFKIGFIAQLSYGPSKEEQREFLLEGGVDPSNIFQAPSDTPLDAANACRPGNLLTVVFEQVIGAKFYGKVFALLDEHKADLYSIATDTVYPCKNGKTFGAFKEIMDKAQTASARAAQKDGKRGKPPIKLTKKQLEKAELMLARGKTATEVQNHFGVANNYLSRKGITVKSAKAKYDKK